MARRKSSFNLSGSVGEAAKAQMMTWISFGNSVKRGKASDGLMVIWLNMDGVRVLEGLAAMFAVLWGLKGGVCGCVMSKELEMDGCLPTECAKIALLKLCFRAIKSAS